MSISQFVIVNKPKSNLFNLSHTTANTCNAGDLRVNLCELALPGDKWLLNSTSLVRSQAMITSPFQNIRINQRFFFVPLRFLMDDFENFITGGLDGTDATPHPYVDSGATGWSAGSLMDDLGAATNYTDSLGNAHVVPDMQASAFAPRAYNKVINDWFINENLQGAERTFSTGSGLDTTTDLSIYNICWKPDYFTNGLPFTGRGPATSIPISGILPVKGNGMTLGLTNGTTEYGLGNDVVSGVNRLTTNTGVYGEDVGTALTGLAGNITSYGITTDPDKSGIVADASSASMIDINQLRELIAINNQKQISAYVGGRFTEWLLGMWGVKSSDLRLQRSHYLGGATTPLYIESVEQTSSTDAVSPQANLAGRGVSVNYGNGFKYFVEEPGIILGMFWIMPDSKYFQGQRRWLSYEDRLDYPNPRLALIGDQATKESEIFAQGKNHTTTLSDGTVVGDDTIFNFNPRFEEIRYIPSSVHGEFKTNMKHYHLAREFAVATPPVFNTDFANGAPSKRIFAVTTQSQNSYVYETGFKIKAWRRFPKNGFPATFGLI